MAARLEAAPSDHQQHHHRCTRPTATPWQSIMPFHSNHQQQSSQSNPPYPQENYYSAANAAYLAGQPLNSAIPPTNQWVNSKNTPAVASDDRGYQSLNFANSNGTSEQGLSLRSGPPTYGAQNTLPSNPQPANHFQTPRRTLTIGRPSEELHIPQTGSAMSDVHHYGAPPAYGGDSAMQYQQAAPQQPNSIASNPVPGSLQPGMTNRPVSLSSSNTAPVLPTLPQISTQMQQPSGAVRSIPLTHTHSYSRSSPGTMDQPKYKPFSNTPEASKYASPTSSYMPQTPHGASSYSPLGLADIRPRTEIGFSDGPMSPGVISDNEALQYPSNSNYVAPWPIYALDWCKWPPRSNTSSAGKIAIGSYLEDNHNFIQILDAQRSQIDPDNPHGERGLDFTKTAEATHSYPVTRILWEPPSSNKQTTDLLATSGDHLRLWSLPNDPQNYQSNSITRSANAKEAAPQKLSPLALLSNSKSPEHTAPITSLDWNVVSPSLIITSSIDTTCTIWDIPTLTAKTQLIAHDKEVFDVRFCAASVDVFVSCGADGSVRMFDLRSLEHSTIIYEPSDKQDKNATLGSPDHSNASPSRSTAQTLSSPPPLLRIAASPHDAHLLATFSQDSSVIRVLDVRQPGQALLELKGHGASVNCIEWSNTQRGVLASGADDCCVLVWDLMGSTGSVGSNSSSGVVVGGGAGAAAGPAGPVTNQERGPTAAWECGFEVSNLSWAPNAGTLGVCAGRGFWGVQM